MNRTTGSKQSLETKLSAESSAENKPVVKNQPDQRERLHESLAAIKKSAEGGGPTLPVVNACDVAKLLHEASGRVLGARMVIKCVLNQADTMIISYLNHRAVSPLLRSAWTEELLDFEGASKGVLDLLAALERDLCEASESAKTGGIGFLKPYFNCGVLRGECDEIYAKYGAPQVRACGVVG